MILFDLGVKRVLKEILEEFNLKWLNPNKVKEVCSFIISGILIWGIVVCIIGIFVWIWGIVECIIGIVECIIGIVEYIIGIVVWIRKRNCISICLCKRWIKNVN